MAPRAAPWDPSALGAVARRRRSAVSGRAPARRLFIVGIVLAAALGAVLYEGLGNALSYDMPVNQAVAQRTSLGSQVIRIEGKVDPRSIHRTGTTSIFAVTANGVTEEVHAPCCPPQLFGPNAPVIVVGHFQAGADYFDSQQIMVAHGNVYTPEVTTASQSKAKAASQTKVNAAPQPEQQK